MRQWMVNPKIMCQKHLCGEHVEHHMFIGSMIRQKSIRKYIDYNLLEPLSLLKRHDELVKEMLNRKYNHKSPLIIPKDLLSYLSVSDINNIIDRKKSLMDLIQRCPTCFKLYKDYYSAKVCFNN